MVGGPAPPSLTGSLLYRADLRLCSAVMNMGGGRVQQSTGQVTFVYEPTRADYAKAVRRFTFGTWPGLRGQVFLALFTLALSWTLPTLKGFSPTATAFVMACAVVAVLVTLPGSSPASRGSSTRTWRSTGPVGRSSARTG